jgi:hypothetical protein
VSSRSQPLSWREVVEQSWPAITASELLTGGHAVWLAEGLQSPDEAEAVALAAMGRVVRYGQSVSIALPFLHESRLPRFAFYLHRLRLDAAQGLVRSSWFNRVSMALRNDLLVFGRPRRMLRDFATSTVMRPQLIEGTRQLERTAFQRTLLVDGHGDLLATLDLLERQSSPFAIIVAASAQGCDENTASLLKALPTVFPDVPIVSLGYTGAAQDPRPDMHTWVARLGDHVRKASPSANVVDTTGVEVIAAHDPTMDGFAKKLGYLVWNLKRLVDQSAGHSQELTALLAVDRVLRCLNVPLSVHEQGTIRRIRGGLFPVRPVQGWLDMVSRMRVHRGDIQALLDEVLALVRQGVRQLENARPGRVEVLLGLASDALKRDHRMCILVGGQRDAAILQEWIVEELGPDSVERIRVSYMDGATAVSPQKVDVVVYAAPLFPSRRHWLGVDALRKIVLCHPFEQERVCAQVDHWWRNNALPSARYGDKLRLWNLEWKNGAYLEDQLVEDGHDSVSFARYLELAEDGYYPETLRVAHLEVSRSFDDWLQTLLAEPVHVYRDVIDETDLGRDMVVLYLDGQNEPLRWRADRQIMRLEGEAFVAGPAEDLQIGHELVILGNSEERVATQRELFEMFAQNNHGLQQTLGVAEKWQEYVDAAVAKQGSIAELTRYLKGRKFEITPGAVQHWAAGKVIGPKNPSAIRLLAELAEIPNAVKMANLVDNAITVIRSEHRRIGADIRKAVATSRGRDVSAVQIGSRTFLREVFDSMLQVCRVVRIERPAKSRAIEPGVVKTIRDVARNFGIRHESRIVFTSGCQRSMTNSPFEDLDAFGKILTVLVEGFYPMYSEKSLSLAQVENMLAPIPASYAGNMSAVTKGKHEKDYFKLYKGETIDASRHIRLGRAFDPRYTLRLHFHWDVEDKRIVVHHAGEHLPTLNG